MIFSGVMVITLQLKDFYFV